MSTLKWSAKWIRLMTVPFWIHFRKGANWHQDWGKGTAHSFNMFESTGRWHIKPKHYWKASFLSQLQMRCDVRKNPLWALFTSFLALWWVTKLQRLQKGKAETVAENKKERVRRKGTKGRERQEIVGERDRERVVALPLQVGTATNPLSPWQRRDELPSR